MAAAASRPPAPRAPAFRLVDDFEAARIRFAGREPRTLEELAVARADHEHRRRLAEIKKMAAKLTLLQAFLPQLAERGIRLADRKIESWDGGATLRIASATGDNKMHAALIDLGFREIERKHLYRNEYTVKLQHGRWLVVSFIVTEPETARSAS